MDPITTILLLIVAFQFKHLIADFFLQNAKMIMGREKYWHMGRAQHAGIHTILSLLVLVVFGTAPMTLFWLLLAEFIVHSHIDWAKAKYSCGRQLDPTQRMYWIAMGTDQALHQLTYVAMVWFWINA